MVETPVISSSEQLRGVRARSLLSKREGLNLDDIAHFSLLAAFIVVGAWLRLTALSRQSLWFDECDVVVRAQQSLSAVLHTFTAQGENGPLYNLFLHFWMLLFGSSEAWVRLPSAVAGVLAIPVIYLVGSRTIGRRVGLFAAGLLTISPYHDWYSQEAKMYSIAVLLTLLSTLFFIEALRRNGRWWWAAYVIAMSLSFYTHVTTVLIFVAQCAFFVITWKRWEGRHKSWIISVALLTLPYLPIALWASRVVLGAAHTWQSKVSLWQMIQIEGTKWAVNRDYIWLEVRGRLIYACLAGLGLVAAALAARRRESAGRWTLLFGSLIVLPVILFWILTFKQPLFNDRYLIMSLPAYLILVALGLRFLERRAWPVAIFAMVFVIAYAWVPLRDINRSSQPQKEDWRGAYYTLVAHAQPKDLIVIEPGYLVTTYDYYAEHIESLDSVKITTIPYLTTPGFDARQMADRIRAAAPGNRVWLVVSPDRVDGVDPQHQLQGWLQRGGKPLFGQAFNGVTIDLYKLPPTAEDPAPGQVTNASSPAVARAGLSTSGP